MADDLRTLAEMVTLNDMNLVDAGCSDVFSDAPVLARLHSVYASNGTNHKYLKETAAPVVGFRAINAGRDHSSSTDELVEIALKLLDFTHKTDKALADAYTRGGAEAYLSRETARHLRAAVKLFERCVFYGTGVDAGAFAGLIAATPIATLAGGMVINAAGASVRSSVYMIRTTPDERGVCAIAGNNGRYTASADGKFLYAGSHMQTHAARYTTLGNLANAGLADAILAELGMSAYAPNFRYTQPQLAGGIATSANVYAAFLRKMLRQELTAGSQLNAFARCTNPLTCASAIESPFPPNESPNYSIGHWVEDTIVSDGAYSSAGAFGFYPWIDPTKANYGVVARADLSPDGKQAMESVTCGRKLRQAWATGVAP